MRVSGAAATAMAAGLDDIRNELEIPSGFSPEVLAAAERAIESADPFAARRADRTAQRFVTLDPESSVDLDQAFDIEMAGDDIVLHYAIADVGAFVTPGDALDREAFDRAVTVYLPDRRATLYPPTLSEGAASLLPGVDRPAVVFEVAVRPDGVSALAGVERALVRSHAKLAYDTVEPGDLPAGFDELHRRIIAAEARRGAPRVEFPEQIVERGDDGRYHLAFRPRLASEEQNAALSLATNLAVADALHEARTGLFRVMPEVDERRHRRLRHSARAFGLEWPDDLTLDAFERSLPRDDPRTSAFLIAVRRAAGGASYEPYDPASRPWHSAVAATYAQATAPLRRLQDRYVIEAALAVGDGRRVPDDVIAAFGALPAAMSQGEQRANRAERAALDLAEALVLSGREGEIFDAVVVDEGDWGVEVQICEPAVLARVEARRVDPGDELRVRLVATDIDRRAIEFERVS